VSDDVDFFISFNSADTRWAEWIAWTLREDGKHKVLFQLWDFPPGTNFVLQMHDAALRARHTIAVLSPAYLRSGYAAAEWAAAVAQDPLGQRRRLIPVMVAPCELDGLLTSIVRVSLIDLEEAAARETLLRGVADPSSAEYPAPPRPAFPGPSQRAGSSPGQPGKPAFPGAAGPAPAVRAPVARQPRPVAGEAPATAGIPWRPLPENALARWPEVPSLTQVQLGSSRVELHLYPALEVPPAVARFSPSVQGALVAAGQRNGVFPAEATVDVYPTGQGVQAVLADSAGAPMTGLRIGTDGYRCGWLTLPLTRPGGRQAAALSGLTSLLSAVTALRPALPGEVALSVAIRGSSGTGQVTSPGALSSRYLAGHAQHVASDLAMRLFELPAVEL